MTRKWKVGVDIGTLCYLYIDLRIKDTNQNRFVYFIVSSSIGINMYSMPMSLVDFFVFL